MLVGCEKATPPAPVEAPRDTVPAPRGDLQYLARCLGMGFVATQSAEPSRRHVLVTLACGRETGLEGYGDVGFHERVSWLLDNTDLACTPEAKTRAKALPDRERLAQLRKDCGDQYYGLTPNTAPFFSSDWFVLQRTGAWIARELREVPPDVFESQEMGALVKAAQADVQIPLPLPSHWQEPKLELPRPYLGIELFSLSFVVATETDVWVAQAPLARLGEDGIAIQPSPSSFPGRRVALASLRAALEKLNREPPSSYTAPVLSIAIRPPVGPVLRGLDASVPALVADKRLPARRVADIAVALGERGMALVTGFGEHRSSVTLRAVARPSVIITLGDRIDIAEAKRRKRIDAQPGRYQFKGIKEALAAQPDLRDKSIEIRVSSDAVTHQDLVTFIDALGAQLVREASLRSI